MTAAVAFLALALAVIVQSARLHQALIREQRLRAEAEFQRAEAERRDYSLHMAQAEAAWAEYHREQAIVEEQRKTPAALKP
jgi:hypothetical protein